MEPFEELYGKIGLGLITVFIPMLLQTLKQMTGWKDSVMYVISLAAAYLFSDLYMLALFLLAVTAPTSSDYIFFVLGALIYPLFVWFGMKGIYSQFLKPKE